MIIPKTSIYINFNRNAEEAFNFYKLIFGGDFTGGGIMRMKDFPPSKGGPKVAEEDKNLIMHIELQLPGGVKIMGTDAPESMGFKLIVGNNISICLDPDSREKTRQYFDELSKGGKVTMKLEDTFWGAYFGTCTDKFGIQWMFNCTSKI